MLTEGLRAFVMRIACEQDRRIHSPNANLPLTDDPIPDVA